MRNLWSRGAGSAAALVLFGVLGLATVFPLLSVTGRACVQPIPFLAPLGLHLDLLSAVANWCPEHSFLPGASFGPTVQFFVLLFTTTAVAGALQLALTLGIGYWAARTLRSAHAWLRGRLAPTAPAALRRLLTIAPAPAPVAVRVGIGLYRPTQRRGPPLG